MSATGRRLLVVAHLSPRKRGSLEQQLARVAARLAARDVATTLLVAGPPCPSVAAELRAAGAEWETIDFQRPLATARAVAAAITQLRPAVVHCHFLRVTHPAVAVAAAASSCVVNDHMVLKERAPTVGGWLKRRLVGLAGSWVARRVAVSRCVAASVLAAEAVAPERMVVIENGVDVERFAAAARDRRGARAALDLPPAGDGAAPVIACVARMAREKGVDVAVRALAYLAARRPGARPTLLIVGDGPDRAACEQLARQLGLAASVRFLGLRSDVELILAAADQAWVPSRNDEAFGLAAAEAMAAARPVVATRAGALEEVVADGLTGLLVPPDDPAELAAAAAALLDDPTRARGLAAVGQRRAADLFDLDRFARRVTALYGRLEPSWTL